MTIAERVFTPSPAIHEDKREEEIKRLRLEQALMGYIGIQIDLGILSSIATTISHDHICRVMKLAADKGIPGANDIRQIQRMNALCEVLAMKEGIFKFFHSADSPISKEAWKDEMMLGIEPLLYSSYEHSVFILSLLSESFLPRIAYDFMQVRKCYFFVFF
jgi:hypothetical protein